jgi:hypothetical protein
VLEKTAAKLDSYFVHKEFFVIYGDISKVDILIGEVLNMQQDVLTYHYSNSVVKLVDLMDEELCKELDTIFYTVLKQQKNFKHAIKQLKQLLGTA